MSWRNHETHAEETKAVKAALKAAGINAVVGHGAGTAWSWLEINIGAALCDHSHWPQRVESRNTHSCRLCAMHEYTWREAGRIAREVTGRHGDHGGEILVLTQDDLKGPIMQPYQLEFLRLHPEWTPRENRTDNKPTPLLWYEDGKLVEVGY